jgi:HD-like signal output (HDOD) protein/DNA-binding response OmpR family regulator
MKSILVIDDMAIFRDPIAASLRLAGYKTFCAKDGTEGLAQMRSNHPDLVLLDISMPVLDGISVLRAMQRDPLLAKIPVILLTALSDKKYVVEAAKLGIRNYLLKSRFSLAELNERIKLMLNPPAAPATPVAPANASSTAQAAVAGVASQPDKKIAVLRDRDLAPLMNQQQCISRVEACMKGKTLSGAVAEVMMLASRPSAELKDLSALITRDPVLSVRVLQMANSAAFFSRRGAVTTITEAVKNIGANNVRNIAASVGIFDAMPESSPDGFNPIRCWQHSFAVARLCESFVSPTAPQEAGVAYLIGLCHDLGEIMFRTQFEQEYKSVLEEQQRTGSSLEDVELRLLGMTRMDILKVILKCMGLPETIRHPIDRLQKSGAIKISAADPLVLRALAMAENYANGLLLVSSASSEVSPITVQDWNTFSGQTPLPVPDGEEVRSTVYCLTAILSRMSSAAQASLQQSPFKKSPARILLVRDPVFSAADPFALVLGGLAEVVEVRNELPRAQELAGFSSLAIESRRGTQPGWSKQEINALRQSVSIPSLWITNNSVVEASNPETGPCQAISIGAIQGHIGLTATPSIRAAA